MINYTYKYVRYWAAIGLFSQPYGVKIKEKQLLKHLENETFEPTRVYLSSLLYKLNSKQIDKARALLSESNPELLRISLQLLITMDNEKQNLIVDDIENLYNQKN